LNDARYFDLETNECKYIKTWGDFIEGRRNHSGVMVSKIMVVCGGINNNGRYLNDLIQLNLDTHKWFICEVENSNLSEENVAFHTMCSVFKGNLKISSLYSPLEYQNITKKGSSKTSIRNIQEEGIYLFGGKNKNNEPKNQLKILKIGKKPLIWIQPITSGIPPCARYQHTMNFQEEFNFLIIYGGRNDSMGGALGDMFVLRLSNLNWYNVHVYGNFIGKERFGHCSASVLDKFLVFGGVNSNGFSQGELLVFELSSN